MPLRAEILAHLLPELEGQSVLLPEMQEADLRLGVIVLPGLHVPECGPAEGNGSHLRGVLQPTPEQAGLLPGKGPLEPAEALDLAPPRVLGGAGSQQIFMIGR
jgi:hypothetical protein